MTKVLKRIENKEDKKYISILMKARFSFSNIYERNINLAYQYRNE